MKTSRDVLRALPGMGDDSVDRFLQLRQGPDGIDGTADDFQFTVTAGTQVPPEVWAAPVVASRSASRVSHGGSVAPNRKAGSSLAQFVVRVACLP